LNDWVQHVRNDGFRPLVFLNHGLWLAIFMAVCCVAAVAYIRLTPPSRRLRAMIAALWLLVILVSMNSLGGLLIAVILIVPAFFLTGRMQMWIATGLVSVVLIYPMMRGANLIPTQLALSVAEDISAERSSSLDFRFRNEDLLLSKSQQRPLFGWGSWGRNQVFDENGTDISVTDGSWIILIGSNGWIGYLTKFGLLCIPMILLTLNRRRYPTDLATAAIMMMLCGNLLDLIPNATLTPITWLLAGALIGRLEYNETASVTDPAVSDDDTVKPNTLAYSRQTTRHHRRTKAI
jgi:hypothetical protein